MPMFNHTALRRPLDQIRLIRLDPGTLSDPIQCTIEVHSLDEYPYYEALSYAWGESDSGATITLDKLPFIVSTCLVSALHNIRDDKRSRTLWVDALCIDQKNRIEKEKQVSIMGTIYKNCTNGLLWIGEESKPSDAWCPAKNQSHCSYCSYCPSPHKSDDTCSLKIHTVQEDQILAEKHRSALKINTRRLSLSSSSQSQLKCKHLDCRWHGRRPRISKVEYLMRPLEDDNHLNDIPALAHPNHPREKLEFEIMEPLIALGALMSRSWWTRMWTVQEAILPPISTLCWGRNTYSLMKMARSAEKLFSHSQNCCSGFFTNLIQRLDKLSCDESTVNALFNFQKHVHVLDLTRKWIKEPGTKINLMDCLYNFHDRKSKHPQDKIFACLGLSPSNFGLYPDYEISEQQLYQKISLHLLRQSPDRSLSVLWRESEPSGPHPSWIKEFNRETTALNRRARSRFYDASNGGSIQLRECNDDILSFLGTRVDVVSDVTTNAHSASTYSGCQFSTFREWAQFLELNKRQVSYHSGVSWLDLFSRTLSGDMPKLRRQSSGLSEEKVKGFVQSLLKKRQRNDPIETSLAQELNTSATGRKIFLTKQGYVGLGPEWMRPGDEVWVLSGGCVPFVLRPLQTPRPGEHETATESVQKYHIVIGDCYVQGIMSGEAVSAKACNEHVFVT